MGFLDMDSLPRRVRRKYNDILDHEDLVLNLRVFDSKLDSLSSSLEDLDQELKTFKH